MKLPGKEKDGWYINYLQFLKFILQININKVKDKGQSRGNYL